MDDEKQMFAADQPIDIEGTIAQHMQEVNNAFRAGRTETLDPVVAVTLDPESYKELLRDMVFTPTHPGSRELFGVKVHLSARLAGSRCWGILTFSSGRIEPLMRSKRSADTKEARCAEAAPRQTMGDAAAEGTLAQIMDQCQHVQYRLPKSECEVCSKEPLR